MFQKAMVVLRSLNYCPCYSVRLIYVRRISLIWKKRHVPHEAEEVDKTWNVCTLFITPGNSLLGCVWWGRHPLTFLAHQQWTNEPRADVLRGINVRMVHPGQAVGVSWSRGIFFPHWPDIGIIFARWNHVIIFVLSRCPIWVQGSFQEKRKHS